MTTQRLRFMTALLCLIVSMSVNAASKPVIVGTISGVELCPQSICDQAIFVGEFVGTVNDKGTSGVFLVQVTHASLPDAGFAAAVTGGSWFIRTEKDKVFSGTVTGGTLTNKGDGTFAVAIALELTRGGHGTLNFNGLLNHNVFPPAIGGTVSQ